MVEIRTPRLILRTPVIGDAPEIQEAKREVWNELQLWMSWAYDDQRGLDASERFIHSSLAKSPHYNLLGFCRATGKFVVSTGLCEDAPGVYVTGYWVAKDFLGKGYATEATNAMIRYAFGALKARAVTINYYEGNHKSANVIRKMGFTFEKTVKGGHNRCLDGAPLDVHHFRRTDAAGLPPLEVSW